MQEWREQWRWEGGRRGTDWRVGGAGGRVVWYTLTMLTLGAHIHPAPDMPEWQSDKMASANASAAVAVAVWSGGGMGLGSHLPALIDC